MEVEWVAVQSLITQPEKFIRPFKSTFSVSEFSHDQLPVVFIASVWIKLSVHVPTASFRELWRTGPGAGADCTAAAYMST